MKNDGLISIIMPAKNAAPYLNECLLSIINQSYQDWELLIVDDHSTDDSIHIISQYQVKDSRISCYKNNETGIIPALQLGYSHAKGSYITRMDADDIMTSNKLVLLHNALLNNPNTVSTGYVKYFSNDELGNGYIQYEQWLNSLVDSHTHWKEIYKECVIPSPCWMVSKEDFDRIGGFSANRYPEDYDLCFRMYKHGLKVSGVTQLLHYWRDYPTRTSRTDKNYADNRFLALKMHYFLDVEKHESRKLVLWGAGKKGKYIARILSENNITFDWITNNPKKIGKHIYTHEILSISKELFRSTAQIIVAVANKKEQKEISSILSEFPHSQVYFFS